MPRSITFAIDSPHIMYKTTNVIATPIPIRIRLALLR